MSSLDAAAPHSSAGHVSVSLLSSTGFQLVQAAIFERKHDDIVPNGKTDSVGGYLVNTPKHLAAEESDISPRSR